MHIVSYSLWHGGRNSFRTRSHCISISRCAQSSPAAGVDSLRVFARPPAQRAQSAGQGGLGLAAAGLVQTKRQRQQTRPPVQVSARGGLNNEGTKYACICTLVVRYRCLFSRIRSRSAYCGPYSGIPFLNGRLLLQLPPPFVFMAMGTLQFGG